MGAEAVKRGNRTMGRHLKTLPPMVPPKLGVPYSWRRGLAGSCPFPVAGARRRVEQLLLNLAMVEDLLTRTILV